MTVRFFDEIDWPHYLDRDEPKTRRAWCCYCQCNVDVVKRDCGIGRYEYWGYRGVHIDMRDTCSACGEERLEEEHRVYNDEEIES